MYICPINVCQWIKTRIYEIGQPHHCGNVSKESGLRDPFVEVKQGAIYKFELVPCRFYLQFKLCNSKAGLFVTF